MLTFFGAVEGRVCGSVVVGARDAVPTPLRATTRGWGGCPLAKSLFEVKEGRVVKCFEAWLSELRALGCRGAGCKAARVQGCRRAVMRCIENRGRFSFIHVGVARYFHRVYVVCE